MNASERQTYWRQIIAQQWKSRRKWGAEADSFSREQLALFAAELQAQGHDNRRSARRRALTNSRRHWGRRNQATAVRPKGADEFGRMWEIGILRRCMAWRANRLAPP